MGRLYETDYMLVGTEIRSGISAEDVEGGAPVVLGAVHSTEKDCYVATQYATAGKSVYIAYNPEFKMVNEGTNEFVGRNLDSRIYKTKAGNVFGCFKPTEGIEFGIIASNIVGDVAPTVGKFLEPTNASNLYTIKATQTSDVPSFEVIDIKKQHFPNGEIGGEWVEVYVVKTRFNG